MTLATSLSAATASGTSGADLFLWAAIPYLCLGIFVVGHVWRYRHDQFGWTSRTSQLLEKRWLRLASPLFHVGMLMVIGGHAVGLFVPQSWTDGVGISDHVYHTVAVTAGTIAGVALLVGFGLLCARRLLTGRIRTKTDGSDKVLFPLLAVVTVIGFAANVGLNIVGDGYNYRETISVWIRGIATFQPDPGMMADVPLGFQLHVLSAFVLFAVWPFTRLVHVWSVPIGYLVRPYVVYRYRSAPRPGQVGRAVPSQRSSSAARAWR